jgi:hypothetical protein
MPGVHHKKNFKMTINHSNTFPMAQKKILAADVARCYQIYVQYLKYHRLKDDSADISVTDLLWFVDDQIDEEEQQQLYESYQQDNIIFNTHVKSVFDQRIADHNANKG